MWSKQANQLTLKVTEKGNASCTCESKLFAPAVVSPLSVETTDFREGKGREEDTMALVISPLCRVVKRDSVFSTLLNVASVFTQLTFNRKEAGLGNKVKLSCFKSSF